MDELVNDIKNCTECSDTLLCKPRPVISVSKKSKVAIIGQAPGRRVFESGIPWNDPSGDRLRYWLDVTNEEFYYTDNFAIVPMGFCYPGTGKSGDLPPSKKCAPLWHEVLWQSMPDIKLFLLIGNYAQRYYLRKNVKKTLTETVRSYQEYLPKYFVLPHPSPRNNIWIKKNPWFEEELIPVLRERVLLIISSG